MIISAGEKSSCCDQYRTLSAGKLELRQTFWLTSGSVWAFHMNKYRLSTSSGPLGFYHSYCFDPKFEVNWNWYIFIFYFSTVSISLGIIEPEVPETERKSLQFNTFWYDINKLKQLQRSYQKKINNKKKKSIAAVWNSIGCPSVSIHTHDHGYY